MIMLKSIRTMNGMTQAQLAEKIGVAQNTLSNWENGNREPDIESLKKIAKCFHVSVDLLLSDNPGSRSCPECGLMYISTIPSEVVQHERRHAKWLSAIDKFGFCWSHVTREEIKNNGRTIMRDASAQMDDRVGGAIDVLKSYFSRSLEASDYDLHHVDFPTFAAMLLNQEYMQKLFPQDVYSALVAKYGKQSGIVSGTYYDVENAADYDIKDEERTPQLQAAAAHFDLNKLTDEGLERYNEYIQYLSERFAKE